MFNLFAIFDHHSIKIWKTKEFCDIFNQIFGLCVYTLNNLFSSVKFYFKDGDFQNLQQLIQDMNIIRPSFKSQAQVMDPMGASSNDFIKILTQLLQQSPPLAQKDKGKIITINNHAFIERRNKYTKELKQELDPRDRQIILPFQTQFSISNFEKQNVEKTRKLTNSEQYFKMRREVYDYVSQVCQNVNSATFQLLNRNKLTEDQAKVLASKNILANIQSVLTQVKRKFKQSQEPILQNCCQGLLEDLTLSIDEQLREIMSQLANHYPQASAAGETARMREVVTDIERSQDQHTDLIFANKIQVSKYIKPDEKQNQATCPEDCNGFIMEVINKAINVTREPFSNQSDQTIFEKFVQFSENLFCIGQNSTIGKAQEEKVIQYFKQLLLPPSAHKPLDERQIFQNKEKEMHPQLIEDQPRYNKQLQQMRSQHKYGIAQKIPNYVKPFTDIAIKNASFEVYHSSVLRIMAKWAEYLQDLFQRPQIHIKQRVYDFKNSKNQLCPGYINYRNQTCDNLKKEYVQVKKSLKEMQKRNTLFQSHILSQTETGTTYLKRFNEVRSASSQINTVLIEFTRKYLCILIHHVIKAGKGLVNKSDYINLVMFRVCDLLRSKLQCSESSFISILKVLYMLDQSKEMEGKFKLVRIKNKLNDKDNNILINYMFMGKIQCQLQLSIQDMAAKDKNYYAFTHFLYQLTRGKFGVLTECSMIVSQYDSIVNSFKGTYYRPKHYQKILEGMEQSLSIHKKDESIYKCWKCHQLIFRENTQLFLKQFTSCNQCIAKENNSELKLKDKGICELIGKLKSIKDIKGNSKVQRLTNYEKIKDGHYVLSLSNGKVKDAKETVKLFRVWQHKREFKLFMVGINNDVLSNYKGQEFNISGIDYYDISLKQKKQQELLQITYILNKQNLAPIFDYMQMDASLRQKLDDLLKQFEHFRLQKKIIKFIKTKSEIIDMTGDALGCSVLTEVVQAFEQNRKDRLLYKKYNVLDYKHIKIINLLDLKLRKVAFLNNMIGVTKIDLRKNQISEISFEKQVRLQKLLMWENQLKSISLTKCTELIQLHLHTNKLASIDLTNNINLTEVYLATNQLKSIDLTNNINLSCLDLSQNQITFIDVAKNTNLTQLYLQTNLLKSINLDKNINLTKLGLQHNKLTSIDLSHNPNITELQLSNNMLRSITFWYSLYSEQWDIQFGLQDADRCFITILHRKEQYQMCKQMMKQKIQLYSLRRDYQETQYFQDESNTRDFSKAFQKFHPKYRCEYKYNLEKI